MKKYLILGLLAGTAISLLLFLARKKELEGEEFEGFIDSSNADDLFGSAFRDLPDKP
ncbi:MAG TPA: hypothetical protein VMU30_04310 [Bacteroidota bacterium]|nr:hypothetical protein [Bacteroidota bacterium]